MFPSRKAKLRSANSGGRLLTGRARDLSHLTNIRETTTKRARLYMRVSPNHLFGAFSNRPTPLPDTAPLRLAPAPALLTRLDYALLLARLRPPLIAVPPLPRLVP